MGRGEVEASKVVQDEDIWNQILSAARKGDSFLDLRTAIILGDRNSGKSALLARMQGEDISTVNKGVALSYSYLDVFEDESDPVGRIDVWTMEGELAHRDLLRFALNESTISKAVVIITLDFSQPWGMIESFQRWISIIKDHISVMRLKDREGLEQQIKNQWQSYKEPQETAAQNKKQKKKRNVSLPTDPNSLPPLSDDILTHNLGIPIIVACCKSDSVVMLEKDFDYKDGLFEYIQTYLRRLCLKYGATLMYTSAKKDINCELLVDYIEHRFFGFEFNHHAQLHEKDAVFVPAGWDNMAKVSADFSNQNVCKDPEEPYETVVKKPTVVKRREQPQITTITADEDQDFLQRHKSVIDKEEPEKRDMSQKPGDVYDIRYRAQGITMSPEPSTPPRSPLETRPFPQPDGDELVSPKKVESPKSMSPDTSKDKAVLADFFKSLMQDKSRRGSGSMLMTSKPSAAMFASQPNKLRQDAEKELDRLKKAINNKK